jgi:hypothetical protein
VGWDSVRRAGRGRIRPAADRMPRRATDRIEDLVAWLLVAAALLMILLAITVATAVHRNGVQRAALEMAHRHQISAELIARPAAVTGRYQVGTARWTTPDGAPRIGRVPITAIRPDTNGTVRIWVDDDGAPSRPPSTPAGALQAAIAAAVAMALVGLGTLAAAWAGVRVLVDRANAARWEREWARVGPRWSRRVH